MLKFYLISFLYFLILATFCGLAYFGFPHAILYIILFSIIYFSTIYWGASKINSQLFVKTYCSNPRQNNKIAITFDDGPDAEKTSKILDILLEYNIKASFFFVGNKIKNSPKIAARAHSEGHLIGGHSYSHSNLFPLFNSKKIRKEIIDTQDIIFSATGFKSNYFRPPFGVTNPLIAKALKAIDIKTIGWSIRSLDTLNGSSTIVVDRIKKQIKSGDIILLHDTSNNIIEILKELLDYFKEKNIKPITIEELLFHDKK
ncbi:MAG: polysaccharide deacetylase family protein [Bacteroidota bacterium]